MVVVQQEPVQQLTPDTYVKFVLRTLWENLPQVIGGGLLFSLCCVPAFLLFGLGFLAPTVLVAVVTIAPAWCALLAFAQLLIQEERADFARFGRLFYRHWRAAALLGMTLAFPLLITLTTLPLLQVEPVPVIVWLGLSADFFMVALVTAVLFYAFPLLLTEPTALPTLLRRALVLAAVHPFNTVGLLAMGLLFAFLIAYVSLGLLLLLPAIYALFIIANYQLVHRTAPPPAKGQ